MRAILSGIALAVFLAPARARACDEVSDVVGYRRCSSFGSPWDESPVPATALATGKARPVTLPLFVEVAGILQTVDAGSVTFSDRTADSRSFSLHNPALGAGVVYGLDLRAGFRVAGPFYAGMTTRLAFGRLTERATALVDGARVDLGDGLGVVEIGGLIGIARPLSSWARLRIELTSGLEDPGLLAVAGIACSESSCAPDSPGAFLEPHVIVDLRLGRSWSLGPFAGDDVLHPSRVTLGLLAAWRWQGFDGQP
jgi:hypothetical protein